MSKKQVFLTHPDLEPEEKGVTFTKEGSVDGAGYRPIAAMVASFRKAGIRLEAFRAAEFSGDMELNPLHRYYVDPVDRDEAMQAAIARGKEAKQEFLKARRASIDKKRELFENEVQKMAAAIERRKNALSSQSRSEVPPQGQAPLE